MAKTRTICDIAVIGGGIAGASVAAELAKTGADVRLLEREPQPGIHSTGRSAAQYTTTYGPVVIRALTRASGVYLRRGRTADGHALLTERPVFFVARADQRGLVSRALDAGAGALQRIDLDTAIARHPLLRPDRVTDVLEEAGACDIDVDALMQMYLRQFREANGAVMTGQEVRALDRYAGVWNLATSKGPMRAEIVVNAAGAWADEIAAMAGIPQIGIEPRRRTAALVPCPGVDDPTGWPMVVGIDEDFYVKPDAGRLLVSPADATLVPPCDAQPDELDIATGIDRAQQMLNLPVRRVEHSWAGLRCFAPDGEPVVGFERQIPGFFWLAGQGGYGIQTAPAVSRLAAALILGDPVPADIAAQGVSAGLLSPDRLQV